MTFKLRKKTRRRLINSVVWTCNGMRRIRPCNNKTICSFSWMMQWLSLICAMTRRKSKWNMVIASSISKLKRPKSMSKSNKQLLRRNPTLFRLSWLIKKRKCKNSKQSSTLNSEIRLISKKIEKKRGRRKQGDSCKI